MYHQKTMNFSEWLDAKLKEAGWSRVEAAKRGGVSASMYDKVIRDNYPPGRKFIEGVARAFKMDVAEVMKYASDQNARISDQLIQQSEEILEGFELEETRRKALAKLQELKDEEARRKKNGTPPQKRPAKHKST